MNKIVILLLGLALGVSSVGVYSLSAGVMAPPISSAVTHGSTAVTAITASASASSDPPPGCILAKTSSSQGYLVEIYLPSSPKAGDRVCMDVILRNVNSTTSPNVQQIINQISITDSSGRAAFSSAPSI